MYEVVADGKLVGVYEKIGHAEEAMFDALFIDGARTVEIRQDGELLSRTA